LVCHDALKLPDDALPIFLKRVEEIIVWHHYLLKLVVIDRAKKMSPIRIICKIPVHDLWLLEQYEHGSVGHPPGVA
jgi:hypothetical protein